MSFTSRIKIEDLINNGSILVHKDGNHGAKYPRTEEFGELGVPFLTAKLLDNSGNIDLLKAPRLAKEKAQKFTFGFVQSEDVLLSHNATVGRVAVMPQVDEPILIGTSLTHFRLDKSKILPTYLAAYFSGKDFQDQLAAVMSQTTRNQVPITSQRKLYIELPSIEIQAEIVKYIDSIDNKIRLNNKINQTLESIAQAIFKSWFIDFDPVRAKIAAKQEGKDAELAAMCVISGKSEEELKQMAEDDFAELQATAALFPDELVESELGDVPKGWEVGKLQEVIHFNPRRTLKKDSLAPYLDMKNVRTQGHLVDEVILRNMTSGTKFINGDTLLARITPCLENGKTAYVDFLLDNEVGWGSTEFIVLRPKEHLPTALGYFIARQENFRTLAIQSMTGTSGRQRANADTLANQSWLIYPADLMIVFDKYAGKYLTHIKNNGLQNGILKNIRDALLPKLLSGELDATLLKE